MTTNFFFVIVIITDPHTCSQIWDDTAFTLGDQFKPNQTRLVTFYQNFNSLFSMKDAR